MLLTKDALQTITLNAKAVHKYGDLAFFPGEINRAPAHVGDQPFLNFFVRYHHHDAPEQYSWSRVRRVLLLEEAMALQQQRQDPSAPPVTSLTPTMEWRGKTFWICFAVEAVQPSTMSSSLLGSDVEAEEELVLLPQLSNTAPTDEEVLAFCVASANRRPAEIYADGVLGEAPTAPPILSDGAPTPGVAAAAQPAAASDGAAPGHASTIPLSSSPPAALNPRKFLPTARQIDLLRRYKTQHLTHHTWTQEEIETSKALRGRYSGIGVAAAPIRMVAYMQQHRAEERKSQLLVHPSAAAPSPTATAGTIDLSNGHGMAEANRAFTQATQVTATPSESPRRDTLTQAPSTSTATATTVADIPLSPFLPRRMCRSQQQQQQQHQVSPPPPQISTTPDQQSRERGDPAEVAQLGDAALFSQQDASETLAPSQAPLQGLAALSQHLSQLRAAENSFYEYIRNEDRSASLNRLADITKRNSATNARSRRRGIANERRLERKGNLLESRGLWITDDRERASRAEDYVKAQAGGSSGAKDREEGGNAHPSTAGAGAMEDGADATKSAQDIFVERFMAYHDAQRISFAAGDAGDFLGENGGDKDLDPILQAATAAASSAETGMMAASENGLSGATATDAVRTSRRTVRRLLPNRLATEEGTASSVLAQLVHRSTVRMAKRVRVE